ncbi:MAG: redoxin family protein [Deltaproteobacteria bacterium]|nr:redoxin family protein [Deltaproteobacteria bacterium]
MLSMKNMMKTSLLAIAVVLFLWTNTAVADPKPGTIAPSFDIKSTEGHMVNSKDLKGKVVVMFFGTRKVSDYVNDLHLELEETYKGKAVVVFTVAISPPSFFTDGMLKLASKTPMLIDRGGKMSHAFDVADEDGEPNRDLTVLLLDKEWKIKGVYKEDIPEDFEDIVDACLK